MPDRIQKLIFCIAFIGIPILNFSQSKIFQVQYPLNKGDQVSIQVTHAVEYQQEKVRIPFLRDTIVSWVVEKCTPKKFVLSQGSGKNRAQLLYNPIEETVRWKGVVPENAWYAELFARIHGQNFSSGEGGTLSPHLLALLNENPYSNRANAKLREDTVQGKLNLAFICHFENLDFSVLQPEIDSAYFVRYGFPPHPERAKYTILQCWGDFFVDSANGMLEKMVYTRTATEVFSENKQRDAIESLTFTITIN